MSVRLLSSATRILNEPFRLVRDQAFKAMELLVKKLESYAATMVGILLKGLANV